MRSRKTINIDVSPPSPLRPATVHVSPCPSRVREMTKKAPLLSPVLGDCPPEVREKALYVVSDTNQLIFVDLSNTDCDKLLESLPECGCRVGTVQAAILAGRLSPLLLPVAFTTRLPKKKHVEQTLVPMQRRMIAFASGSGSGELLKAVVHATAVVKETVQELCSSPRDLFSPWTGIRRCFQRKCVLVESDASFSPAMVSCAESADYVLSFVSGLGGKRATALPRQAQYVCILHAESADGRLFELMQQIQALPAVERPTVVMFGSVNFDGPSVRSGCLPRNIWKQLLAAAPRECCVNAETSVNVSFIVDVGLHFWLSDTAVHCNNPNIFTCTGNSVEYVQHVLKAALSCNPFSSHNVVLLFEDEAAGKAFQRKYLKTAPHEVCLWNTASRKLVKRNRRKSELLTVDGRCWLGLPPVVAQTTVVVKNGRIPPAMLAAAVARSEETCWIVSDK